MLFANVQNCDFKSVDGQSFSGKIIQTNSLMSLQGNGQEFRLHQNGVIETRKDKKVTDSLILLEALRREFETMYSGYQTMRPYVPKESWWSETFQIKKKGKTWNNHAVERIDISLAPRKKRTDFSFSVVSNLVFPKKGRIDLKGPAEPKAKLPVSIHFHSGGDKYTHSLKKTFWPQSKAFKTVTWQVKGEGKSELSCSKPKTHTLKQNGSKESLIHPKSNFLQVILVSSVLKNIKSRLKGPLLNVLLTGICSKHLYAMQKTIGKEETKAWAKKLGREFGARVTAEFSIYRRLSSELSSISKQNILQAFQRHCSDPLGLLIDAEEKTKKK